VIGCSLTGATIEKLCELQYEDPNSDSGTTTIGSTDKGSMVRAARCLLAAVTQVLLLADTVVVKQLLQAKDKVKLIFQCYIVGLFLFLLKTIK